MAISAVEIDERVEDVRVTAETLEVILRDGRKVCAPLAWFPVLASASDTDRNIWELSGAGLGIHWPKLDEDLSVAGLLRAR